MSSTAAFCEHIRATLGSAPDPSEIVPGRFIRFPVSDHGRDDAGSCKLFDDGDGGVFWNWRSGTSETWQARQATTPEDRAAFSERVRQARAEAAKIEEQRQAKCRTLAALIWDTATPAADHPYLDRKKVKSYGLRQDAEGRLLVPVRDTGGTLHGLQKIHVDGSKRFMSGTAVTGCYFAIGKPNGRLYICEGYATGATIHEATGGGVAVAFNAGNLAPVAVALRAKYPALELIICADDDHATEGNPGMIKATEAARAVGGRLAVPVFTGDRGPKDTDFNDLACLEGIDAVKKIILAATSPEPATSAPGSAQEGAEVWPDPVALPEGLPPVKPLHMNMIPGPLHPWIADIAERMQAPPDFAAAAAVVALGSIIGRGCGIRPKKHDDWLVIPNIWGGVIGRPSFMKTPMVAEAHRHLSRLETEAREAFQTTLNAHEFQEQVNKAGREEVNKEIKKAIGKGATDFEHLREKMGNLNTEIPTRRRFTTQDGTTEKIGELLIENTRGFIVSRDELVGWLNGLDRQGREQDRAFYLEAWNGTGAFTYDRIGRGTLDIPALCLSVFGCITPGGLSDYVASTVKGGQGDDGLLQRFQVLVWPDSPGEWKNVDRWPDTPAKQRAWDIFKRLADDIPGAETTEGETVPFLRYSPEGQAVFDEWRSELETRIRTDLHPAMESHLAKYRKLMPSLSLIFHLVDVADGAPPGPVSEGAAIMAAAWCEYLESHAGRIYKGAVTPEMEAAREIVKRIRRKEIKDGDTIREIWRHHWSRLTSTGEVRVGLAILENYEWLTVSAQDTGGRRSEVVRLNPKILLNI